MYAPLTGLTNARVDLMTSMVSFERVFEVLDTPEPIADRPGAIDLVEPTGRIEFGDVTFRYPPASSSSIASMEQLAIPGADPDRDVLTGVSLMIEPGETLALVGASGAGKSTMMSLIPRLYDVTSGAVKVDGVDVRDYTLASLRGAVGVVAQDPHLFHESIGENLRYAKPDATPDELVAACVAARIHHTIAALPDGYDTVVGERGYRLSGRREAAPGDRPSVAEGPGDHDPRRGDEPPRQRQRVARAGLDRGGVGGSHGDRDRPPPVDRA